MRFTTLILVFVLLFVASTTFAQDKKNPFAANFGNWEMKITKAEPALPDEAMAMTVKATMESTPDNAGMLITWKGTDPEGKPFESKELWYYDATTKKIYGLSNENGRVQRMEGEMGPDGKSMNFTGTMVSNPKETVKLEVNLMDNTVLFKQTFMVDGEKVQYMEGKGAKK